MLLRGASGSSAPRGAGVRRPRQVKRDVECFIRSYVRQQEKRPTDDALEPVLAELGLIASVGGRYFESEHQ